MIITFWELQTEYCKLNIKNGIRRNKIFILTFYTAVSGGIVPFQFILEKKKEKGIWGSGINKKIESGIFRF